MIAATRLYLIFKKVVDDRKKHGITENVRDLFFYRMFEVSLSLTASISPSQDPLQHLIDSGDSMLEIIEFIISSLFAGIVNSGLNAACTSSLPLSPPWLIVLTATSFLSYARRRPLLPLSLPRMDLKMSRRSSFRRLTLLSFIHLPRRSLGPNPTRSLGNGIPSSRPLSQR